MGKRGVGFSYRLNSHSGPMYLQHIGWDATFGDAVAVYSDAALSDYRFSILFPIGSAIKRRIISRLGPCEVPERYQPLRLRYPLGPQKHGAWMIVDGEQQYQVERLSPDQGSFVLAVAVNDTALKELFHAGWREGEPFPWLTSQPS